MEHNNPADHGSGRRYGAEYRAQIAAINQLLDSMEESLLQVIRNNHHHTGPANIAGVPLMLIYSVVKIIREKLILEMGRQGLIPRFQLVYALTAVALGCVMCSLLMYVLFGDLPWQILIPCILMLLISAAFQSED